ncbi:MAG: hypothetical protein GC146_05790 [Limimaricola sp.]|uniref:divergent polysaccharide deacteylase family protein n=1 Tax=Limimaricola sp. TaxID=2211665 RepID=UPI001D6F0E5C|nr:divergent polysaccharide deacetylase family protein [Limimaricola sp.]MBI1416720.1 hypothetical protein [Limimaricola sp.]
MSRGFLAGAVSGGVVALAGLGAVSLMSGPPVPRFAPAPVATAPAAPAPMDAPPEITKDPATSATADLAPPPDDASAPAVSAATPPAPAQSQPDSPAAPPTPPAQQAPDAMTTADALPPASVSSDTAEPATPPADAPQATDLTAMADPGAAAPPATGAPPDAISAETAASSSGPAPDVPPVAAPEAGQQGAGDGTTPAAPDVPGQPVPDSAPQPGAPAPQPAPQAQAAPAAPSVAPKAQQNDAPARPPVGLSGQPAQAMPTGTDTVRVLRPGTASEATAPVAAPVPALRQFAAIANNPDNLPEMAIVLIDAGGPLGDAQALAAMPFPVSVAVDPTQADAAERYAAYRAAGLEVLAAPPLPQGATPGDVEMTYGATFNQMPEAIGVLDTGKGGSGARDAVASEVMANLAAAGRGIVVAEQGLSSALRVAERMQVPAVEVYRDIDSTGQDAQTVRRFVDQAAFVARQKGSVVLVGHVRADTISALTLWSAANRASQVALVPVSALLAAQLPPAQN